MECKQNKANNVTTGIPVSDGGWGWMVVVAAFFVHFIADGIIFSFGAFFMELTSYFQQSQSTTAWIGSVMISMPLLTGPIASSLTSRFGCRKMTILGGLLATTGFLLSSFSTSIFYLILSFGLITGTGLSLCFVAALDSVAQNFDKRRSLALGLAVSGGGIGTFLFAPFIQYLISWYGWKRATQILSGSFLSLCCCGFVLKDLETVKEEKKEEETNNNAETYNRNMKTAGRKPSSANVTVSQSVPDSRRRKKFSSTTINFGEKLEIFGCVPAKLLDTEKNIISTRFLLFICSNFLLYTWYDVPYIYLQTSATNQGYSDKLSCTLISAIGLSNLFGNIFLGYVCDKKWIKVTVIYGVCLVLNGASILFMPFCLEREYWAELVTCAVFGMSIAADCALTPVVLVQIVGLKKFASAYGVLLFVQGVGNLVGPPIAGMISDASGNDSLSFFVAGIGIIVSSCFVLVPIFQR